MSTESIAPYSPNTVYGQLTSPFTPKQITINAHTPYDKVDENESKAYSRDSFKAKPQAKMIYELPDDKGLEKKEFPPKFNNGSDENMVTHPNRLWPLLKHKKRIKIVRL